MTVSAPSAIGTTATTVVTVAGSKPVSDIPAESFWSGTADLTIPDAATLNFLVRFQENLQATGYEVHLVFDIGCQVIVTK